MASAPDIAHLLVRLSIDLVAMLAFSLLVLRRRPRRGLAVVMWTFNVGVFAVLTVISLKHIGSAVGFGLFALLSIVRLRSEPFSNAELSYFFTALVLALVNGLRVSPAGFLVGLDVVVILTLFIVDHPTLYRRTQRRTVTLDRVETDLDRLRAELTERLGVEVVEVAIDDVDYVRDTTRLDVRHVEALA